jgi:hypothetical protein
MSDGPKLVLRPASILAYALRLFFRDTERTRRTTSAGSRKRRAKSTGHEAAIRRRETVDAAVLAYVEWRATCTEVRSAYRSWARAPAPDAKLAYVAYRATLDREQAAAEIYARLMRKVGDLVESGLDYPLSATFWATETK